jgi:O-antigen/teichoic acid export membrane protein
VSLGGGVLIARAIAFLGTAFLTRKLGPYGFGIIGLALAICSYFAMAVQASVAPVGSREVARHPERAISMAKGVIVVRLAMASIGIALVALVVLVIEKPLDVKKVILLTSLIMLSQALITAWVYKGLGRNRMVGMSLILNQIFYVGALFCFVRNSTDVIWVPVAVVLGELAAALFLGIPLFHKSEPKADIRDGIRILKSSKFVVSSRLLTHLIRTTDVVLLGLLVGEDSVGLYTAGYRLCLLVLGIGLALHTAYLPILARAAQRGTAESDRIVRGAFEASTAVALPLVVGGVICSEKLLTVLFGADFEPGAIAFSLLLVGIGFHFIHGLANHVLLVFDKTRADMRLRAIASAINVALNLWWIPRWGIVGAASATLVSQVVITVLSTWVCQRIGVGLFSSRSWKAFLSVAIMAAWLLTIASPWPLGLQITTSALVYALGLLVLGGTPADLRPGK